MTNSIPAIESWADVLVCPLDRAPLQRQDNGEWCCTQCAFVAPLIKVQDRLVPDFRAQQVQQTVSVEFQLPTIPLDRGAVAANLFKAPTQKFTPLSGKDAQFGTKLDTGIQYYCQELLRRHGPDALILDLGCGNGGNRRYLQTLGFRRILTVDWSAAGADMLVDAHRLPLASQKFHMVVSTAVFEHLYNPFIAMSEISRVLNDSGCFTGSASFWEAWHGSSYFHLTPDGWNALFLQNRLVLHDLWPGWGVIPPLLVHVITPGYFRKLGYLIQRIINRLYRTFFGEMALRKLQLRASGSYYVYATRPAAEQ